MNDRPTTRAGLGDGPDPVVVFALRAMAPPEHGPEFWDHLDARLGGGPVTAPAPVVPPEAPPPPPPPPVVRSETPPPPPAPAEVVPLPAPARRHWWMPVAAVLVVALGVAALFRTSSTEVETTPAATDVPVETTQPVPTTAAPAPTTAPTVSAPQTAKPTAPPTSSRATTTTTARPTGLTASPAGLGPLKLGMTAKQAEATGAVGPFQDPLETGGACGHAEPAGTYRGTDFGALFLDGRLARIYVSKGSRVRTPQGIGVGSPASKLSSVPGTRTESPHPYGGGTNVDVMTGDVGYQFTVDQGTVREWSVGTKKGLSLPEGCA